KCADFDKELLTFFAPDFTDFQRFKKELGRISRKCANVELRRSDIFITKNNTRKTKLQRSGT
ncbi:MAG: hypothetical protein QG594_1833, partial [Bacteroidota bacterium]|nr:hypothetical protein [Bacteroidota bacterium]